MNFQIFYQSYKTKKKVDFLVGKKKKKSKKYDPLKMVKKLARDMFIDIPMGEKVFKDKKKYSRKIKHKKRLDKDG